MNIDTGGGQHSLVTNPGWRGPVFEVDRWHSGLLGMVDEALIGIRFNTNWRAPEIDDFDFWEYVSLVLFQVINLTFCIVCIILLVRLLMAMMTNTFRLVHEKAQLEWRLLMMWPSHSLQTVA